MYVVSALLLGYKTYYKAIRLLLRGIINENLLVTISVVGATFVSEHMEGLMVIALYSIGKVFESLAVNKSRKSIEKLAKLQPEYAVVLDKDENEIRMSPKDVEVGAVTIVKAGEKVPLDGVVIDGNCSVDMQSLTGESVPVSKKVGDEILSGSIVLDGVLKIKTTSEYAESTTTKIMNLVENASQNKSKTETFISKITRWYTLAIVVLALVVWGIVWAVTKDFNEAIYRGLIFLVVSCPCAFAISVPLAYFSGLGNASKNGVLIKGSNFLDACSHLSTVAFDKTGTLTTGIFEIEQITSFDKSKDEQTILLLCATGEQYSLHPLAKTICGACEQKLYKATSVKEIAGHGVEFVYKKNKYFVGRKSKNLSSTVVELFENDNKIGQISLHDTIKHTSKDACMQLKDMGVKTVLLSGDNQEIVAKVADEIGVDESYGKLLPQDKYDWIEKNKSKKNTIGYVGDGINDAPSLTLSDVGISMGINGSPASIEASDVVLVDDNPEKIISAIKISKYTRKIVIENITLSAII
ncbi:MAG: cadmium-translocating P-type ATPase, partial [Clostridia bacterium]|nr:cadmium-translocating P-type ATPase [Clostridia bacterium]